MRRDIAYMVTDLREIAPMLKFAHMAIIRDIRDGFEVMSMGRVDHVVLADDEDEAIPQGAMELRDIPAEGKFILESADGSIVFERLTLREWQRTIRPFMLDPDMRKEFKSDEDVNSYFYDYLSSMER